MNKIIIYFILGLSSILISGCSIFEKQLKIVQNGHETSYHQHKGMKYQTYGVYLDLNNSDISNILNEMKERINAEEKTFQKTTRLATNDELEDDKWEDCKLHVSLGFYGNFRNILEKNELIRYCVGRNTRKRREIANYKGWSLNAVVDKNNVLRINSFIGLGKVRKDGYIKVKFIEIDKKFYLIVKFNEDITGDSLVFLHKELLNIIENKKIKSLPEPIKVDMFDLHYLVRKF